MTRPQLSETLTALVAALPLDDAVRVLEMELEIPLELALAVGEDGLVVAAGPGHTRFVSGFLPPTHRTWLRIVPEAADADPWAPVPLPDGTSA